MLISKLQVDKKVILAVFIVFILAMFFRVQYIKDYSRSNVFPLLESSDSYSYFLWAKDIISGDILGSKAFMKWPLYAYFLAFLLKLFNNNLAYVYLFQYILGALNCVLVYFIGRRIFNEATGFIAALLCASYGLFVFYDSLLVYTGLSLFLNSLLFLSILGIKDNPRWRNLFLAGFFLGLCTITQANTAIFGILAILWVLKEKGFGLGRLLRSFSFFLLGLFMVLGSVTLRNYIVEKDFVLISGNLGFNFYSGNSREATGTFFCPHNISVNQEDMFRDARITANNRVGRSLNTREVSDYWFKEALGFIRSQPLNYLKLLFRKIAYVFSPREFVHDAEYYFVKPKIGIFKVMFTDLTFILPTAALGIFLGFKRFKALSILYIALFSLPAGIVLFFVASRYRITVVPYIMLFAGFGIFSLLDELKKKNFLRLGKFFAFLITVYFVANFLAGYLEKTNQRNVSADFESHFLKAADYKNNSDYENALREFDLAHKIQPDNQFALLQSAAIYFRQNDFAEAEQGFKEALKINPLSVDAFYNLGLMYNRQKRFAEAKDALKRTVALDHEDAQAHFELGIAYKSTGEKSEAREEFSLALRKMSCWRVKERLMIEKELTALDR